MLTTSEKQGKLLLVFMVIIGYIVAIATIFGQGRRLTPWELLLGVSLGVIYLILGLNTGLIFDRFPAAWAQGLFFSVQCSLVFGIGLVLGTSGSLFIGVPLAAFAVNGSPTGTLGVISNGTADG